jgi:hypothetical protein
MPHPCIKKTIAGYSVIMYLRK